MATDYDTEIHIANAVRYSGHATLAAINALVANPKMLEGQAKANTPAKREKKMHPASQHTRLRCNTNKIKKKTIYQEIPENT